MLDLARPRHRTRARSFLLAWLGLFGACSPGQSETASGSKSASAATPGAGETAAEPSADAEKHRSALSPIPEVVATVDGHPIPADAFTVRYAPIAATILARRTDGIVPDGFQAMQRRQILEALIWSKRLELEAARGGVDYDPAALAAREAEERAHVRDWPAWLARLNQTEQTRHQANIDYLRERALLDARGLELEPSEDELRAAYEANLARFVAKEELTRASHILITRGPRVGDEKILPVLPADVEAASEDERAEWDRLARARAAALREVALEPGVDFNELALTYSEGPGAFRGGDMGLFPRRQMVAEYADAAFALAPGAISEPIASAKGYYVIKCFGRYPAGQLPFEAVRADLVRELQARKHSEARATLEAELAERFAVVSPILDEAVALRR